MTHPWRDFLTARQARIDAESRVSFPEPAHPGGCRLFDLTHLGLLAVRGADAASFLQGQLTNDIRELSPTHSQISAHCNQKGRLLAILRVIGIDDTIYLQTEAERLPVLQERLSRFILRSQVTLNDASDELIRIGLAGAEAPRLLAEQGLAVLGRENDLALCGPLALIRLPDPLPRFEILGPCAAISELWDALSAQATPANHADWIRHDIEAGLPTIHDRTAEAFVPQMVNLQRLHGLSFHKGCYTGQEVVARMQYLGKLKRRMYLAEVESETSPQPGDELHAPSSTSQQASGWVVETCPLGAGRHALLAVVEIEAAEAGDVRLGEQGPILHLSPPPYGFADK